VAAVQAAETGGGMAGADSAADSAGAARVEARGVVTVAAPTAAAVVCTEPSRLRRGSCVRLNICRLGLCKAR